VTVENEHRVLLIGRGDRSVNGFWVYRGFGAPEPNDEITVESTLGADPRRARVSHVTPGDPFLIHATQIEP
jgi:hypothetical protein